MSSNKVKPYAEYILGNIRIYLHTQSFINAETCQVAEIHYQHSTWSISGPLMIWWYTEQGHLQLWYWHTFVRIFCFKIHQYMIKQFVTGFKYELLCTMIWQLSTLECNFMSCYDEVYIFCWDPIPHQCLISPCFIASFLFQVSFCKSLKVYSKVFMSVSCQLFRGTNKLHRSISIISYCCFMKILTTWPV